VISPTGEMVFYGVLDLLAGPVFLLLFLHGVRNAFDRGAETRAGTRAAAAAASRDAEPSEKTEADHVPSTSPGQAV
jgi:bacteriorhodopsin